MKKNAEKGGWYYKGNLPVPLPSGGSLDAPQRGRLHLVSAPIFLLHSIWPSLANQARPRYPLQSEDAKTNIPALGWCSFLLLSGEATWDKAQARPDTSNQWNPQGLCWVFNEVHCSQLESPSPRNGLTFRLLFVFVLSFGSLQLVDTTTKPPIRRSICLCGQSDSNLSFHHEAKINNLCLVQAHPPSVTPFSLFSAPLQSGITSLFTKNNSWPDSAVVCVTTFGIGDWPVGSLKYKTGHFKQMSSANKAVWPNFCSTRQNWSLILNLRHCHWTFFD